MKERGRGSEERKREMPWRREHGEGRRTLYSVFRRVSASRSVAIKRSCSSSSMASGSDEDEPSSSSSLSVGYLKVRRSRDAI